MKSQNDFEDLIKENLKLLGIKKNQFEIIGEDGQIKSGSNKETDDGFHYLDFEFRQVLIIENMPIASLALLTLLVHQFVLGLGEREDLQDINIDFGPHNLGKSLDIEITFGVREPVYLVEVENSPIEHGGKKWGFGTGGLDVAGSLTGMNVNA